MLTVFFITLCINSKNMETLLAQKTIYSYKEYIAKEEETREKYDFFFGEIFNMVSTA